MLLLCIVMGVGAQAEVKKHTPKYMPRHTAKYTARAHSATSAHTKAKPSAAHVKTLDKIVAMVNSDIITSLELQQAIDTARMQMQQANASIPSAKILKRQVLEQSIMKSLQLQMAKRSGIQIDSLRLNAAIAQIAQSNHMSLADFRIQVQQHGIDYAQYRKQIRDQLAIMQLQQSAVGSSVRVSQQEINIAYLQQQKKQPLQYHIGDILIPLPDTPSAKQLQAAQRKAAVITRRLRAPRANFKKIAAEVSSNQQALQGGDMGWLTTTSMPTLFEPVVTRLAVGGVSEPLRAANGYHILKLFARKAAPGGATKKQVEMQLRQRKYEENLALWLQQMRDSAYVKVLLPGYKDLSTKNSYID